MSLLDALTGDVAAMIDAARRLQSAAAVAHDLIEQGRRELDLAHYEGPAAQADREDVAQVAAATHGLGNALDEVSTTVFRAAAGLPLP